MKLAIFHQLGHGGAKRSLYEQMRRLSKLPDVDIDVYTINADITESELDVRPLAAHSYDYSSPEVRLRTRPLVRSFANQVEIARVAKLSQTIAADIDRRNYDCLFVHPSFLTNGPSLLEYVRTPSLYYLHEPRREAFEYEFLHQPVGGRLKQLKHRWSQGRITKIDVAATRSASMVTCNSYYTMESAARAYGIDSKVCYLGVDTDRFTVGPSRRGAQVLAVGAMHFNKRHDLIIEAAGLLPVADRPEVAIVYNRGSQDYRRHLENRAKQRGVNTKFYNHIPDDKLAELYAESAALIAVARLEPFGFTPLEAMASGTPTIAVRQGGYRETIVHGRNGLFVEAEAKSLADGFRQVLTGDVHFNPKELRQEAKEMWSWDVSCTRLVQLLRECAGGEG